MKYFNLVLLLFCISNSFGQKGDEYYQESKKLTDNKEYDKAQKSINKALKLEPENRDYFLQSIKILYFKTECIKGVEEIAKFLKRGNKMDDYVMAHTCDLFDCTKQNEEADKILEVYVQNKNYKSNEMVVMLAMRLANAKRFEESISYYNEFFKLEPNNVNAKIDLSRIIYSYKGSQAGIDILKNALLEKPNNIDLLKCLASFYFLNKRYDETLEIQNKILLVTYNKANLESLLLIFQEQKKDKEVYEVYKKLTLLDKCNNDYFNKILEYEFNNRSYERIISTSYDLIDCDKSHEQGLLDALHTSFFFCKNFDKGKFYLEKKLSNNPENFNPYYLKILILFKDQQYSDILKYIDLASKTTDITANNLYNINMLRFGYYLIIEDYKGFIDYWKSGDVKSLDNNLGFTFTEGATIKKTELVTDFNKETGVITSRLAIPSIVLKRLDKDYGLKIEINK